MANVIMGGTDAFDSILYPNQHPNNQNFFINQIQSVTNYLTDTGKQFFNNVTEIYERINSSEAALIARNALRAAKSVFKTNHILPLNNLEEVQSALPVMQRWIMAAPELRGLYNQQRCDGYSDSYLDMHPGTIGENHYDYRLVMDEVIVDTDDGGWVAHQYVDDLLEGDRYLTPGEKFDILRTWDVVKLFVERGEEDPSSAFGGKL